MFWVRVDPGSFGLSYKAGGGGRARGMLTRLFAKLVVME